MREPPSRSAIADACQVLQGQAVLLDVLEYRGRRVQNVMIEPINDRIVGWDVEAGAVREFRLSMVARIELAPPGDG